MRTGNLGSELFPRYKIGESLMPSTVHGVCGPIGVADVAANAGVGVAVVFMPKWRWQGGGL
jgi:hypothetical protein